jgi:toxin ParE1/3/4
MKILYTKQAIDGLNDSLNFIAPKVSTQKLTEIRDNILDTVDSLLINPHSGQIEPFLSHFELDYRRIIFSHYKIIYRIEGDIIYITDIFDSRQDPSKMKG